MIAYPEDLLKAGLFLLSLINGTFECNSPTGYAQNNTVHKMNNSESGKCIYDEAFYERYAEYVRDAVSLHSPTLHEGKTIDEMQ